MAIVSVATSDSIINGYLGAIVSAKTGKDARPSIANAVDRLYTIVLIKIGSPRNGITREVINEHVNRIRNAVFGEEVRDAFVTAIQLCYSARGISLTSTEQMFLTNLMETQIGEELKNNFLRAIAGCCQDVRR